MNEVAVCLLSLQYWRIGKLLAQCVARDLEIPDGPEMGTSKNAPEALCERFGFDPKEVARRAADFTF